DEPVAGQRVAVFEQRPGERAAADEPDTARRPEQAVAPGAGAERARREKDLRGVVEAARDHREAEAEENRAQCSRLAKQRHAVAQVAPVAAGNALLALEQLAGNADQQERREEKRDRVQPVDGMRAEAADDRAADDRAEGRREPVGSLQQRGSGGELA